MKLKEYTNYIDMFTITLFKDDEKYEVAIVDISGNGTSDTCTCFVRNTIHEAEDVFDKLVRDEQIDFVDSNF